MRTLKSCQKSFSVVYFQQMKRKENGKMILKNGRFYSVEQDEYCWKVIFEKSDAVIVFKFKKKEFSDLGALVNYVKTCADF